VRVLFDHNVPSKLRRYLDGHDVFTAVEMGWAELENGQLLAAAEANGFSVMVTADQNLSYQQNMTGRQLALVVLSTNNWNILKLNPERVLICVDRAATGSFELVKF
jgi:predicted nuclease of predicted toxin-antitoxin system